MKRTISPITIAVGLLFGLLGTTVHAIDNSIYIDQAGDNAQITITQDGAGNRIKGILPSGNVGTQTDPAKIKGDGVQLTINQVGAGNIMAIGIDSTTAAGGNPSVVSYSAGGGYNTAKIDLNNAGTAGANASTALNITQTDGSNNADIGILGSGNILTVNQAGGGSTLIASINANTTTSTVTQTGTGGDSTTLNLSSSKGTVEVTTAGGTNTTTVNQSGVAGTNGHYTKVDISGGGNTTTINQSGSIDTTVNLKSVGSGNTFSITTHN